MSLFFTLVSIAAVASVGPIVVGLLAFNKGNL